MSTTEDERIYLQEGINEKLNDVDSVIFDCDGVLIDITNSYDLAFQRYLL